MMGKKRFMAQSLPLELFASRKVKKWTDRATAKGVRLADGVGTAPIEELIYVWSGYKRMDSANLATSMANLEYGRADDEDADEAAIRDVLLGIVYRRMGNLAKAKELIKKVIETPTPKGAPHDEWMGVYSCPAFLGGG